MKIAERAGIAPFYVMAVLKAARERDAATGDVLHLEVGQPNTGAPGPALEAAGQALDTGRLDYTDALGSAELRAAIAAHYDARYGLAIDPARVAVTTGASGACVLAFLACFDVGDRVVVIRPGYPCYRHMLSAFGCEVLDIGVGPSTAFRPTVELLDALGREVSELSGLVLASPSNPTGATIGADELAAIAAWCAERGVRLVADEIYHGIDAGEPTSTALSTGGEGVVVVNSFSKYFSMPGWRIGWLVLPDELVDPVERLAQNLTVAPPTLAQAAALGALSAEARPELDRHVERYAHNRRLLAEGLAAAGFADVAPADGAFYLWVDVSHVSRDSQDLCRRWLDELGLAVTPGIDFDPVDGHRFVRFSVAGATEDVAEAVSRLATWTP